MISRNNDDVLTSHPVAILEARFKHAFSVAHWFLIASAVIRMLGLISAVVGIWAAIVSLIPKAGISGGSAFGAALLAAACGYILSIIVAAPGHLINSTTVTAINTSSIGTSAEKEAIILSLMPIFDGWAGFKFGSERSTNKA